MRIVERAFSEHCGFHPKQTAAYLAMYERPNARVLAGGSGFGGKSHLLRGAAVGHSMWLAREGFYLPSYFCTSTYGVLKDRHYGKFMLEWGEWGQIRENDKEFGACFRFDHPKLPPILFRNLDDPNKRRGAEGAAAFVDEITEMVLAAWGGIAYMVRAPGPSHRPILAATNPDGIGHAWVKALWRPHLPLRSETGESRLSPHPNPLVRPEDYIYVPFLPKDNPLYDEETFRGLIAHLPPHVQRARRDGSWNAPEGARFENLAEETHAFSLAERFPAGVPSGLPIYMGIDYGLRAPYAGLWAFVDGDGDVFVYREDYRPGLTAKRQAERIAELTSPTERVRGCFLDPAMWQTFPGHEGPTDKSAHALYEEVLCDLPNFPRSLTKGYNTSRAQNLMTLDRFLQRDNGEPDVWIEAGCQNLWRELTGAVYPKGTVAKDASEDIDPSCPDHAITALYYFLASRHRAPRVVSGDALPTPEAMAAALAKEREKASARNWKRHLKSEKR